MRLFFLALLILFGLVGTGILQLGDFSSGDSLSGRSLVGGIEHYTGKAIKAAQDFSLKDWAREREALARGEQRGRLSNSDDEGLFKLGGRDRPTSSESGFFSKIPLPEIRRPGVSSSNQSAQGQLSSSRSVERVSESGGGWDFGGLRRLFKADRSEGQPDLSAASKLSAPVHEHAADDREELNDLIDSL